LTAGTRLYAAQRGVSGSEVVDREADAELVEGVECRHGRHVVACEGRLGDLQGQPLGREPRCAQRLGRVQRKVGVAQELLDRAVGVRRRDADTAGDPGAVLAHDEGRGQGQQDPVGGGDRVLLRVGGQKSMALEVRGAQPSTTIR